VTSTLSESRVVIDRSGVDRLIGVLRERGYTVMGPTMRGGAIVHGELASSDDLPVGFRDEQEAGTYRVVERGDDALFGYVVGPSSPKAWFHPPRAVLWSSTSEFEPKPPDPPPPAVAFIGVRACEMAAIAVQDRVMLEVGGPDRIYGERRGDAFLVAVNCVEPGGTCFCVSMGTGPRARSGYDLAMTEVIGDGIHHFVVEAGSEAGQEVLAALGGRAAAPEEGLEADRRVDAARDRMGRSLRTDGIKETLYAAAESPHWETVAERCLACTNCTMVCPTCFCSTVEDRTDLATGDVERVRRWDSCFGLEFTLLHGGHHRESGAARYRQWMTHKLASWYDQFGESGCVGCGRCITWCPVGIDITAEAAILQGEEACHG
jgi:sulfhydrogenase subunit beta (sulfur reductase)